VYVNILSILTSRIYRSFNFASLRTFTVRFYYDARSHVILYAVIWRWNWSLCI